MCNSLISLTVFVSQRFRRSAEIRNVRIQFRRHFRSRPGALVSRRLWSGARRFSPLPPAPFLSWAGASRAPASPPTSFAQSDDSGAAIVAGYSFCREYFTISLAGYAMYAEGINLSSLCPPILISVTHSLINLFQSRYKSPYHQIN